MKEITYAHEEAEVFKSKNLQNIEILNNENKTLSEMNV